MKTKIRYKKERKLNKKKFNENIWVTFLGFYVIFPSLLWMIIFLFEPEPSINAIRITTEWFLGGLLFEGLLFLILYFTSLDTKYKKVTIREEDLIISID